MKLVYRGGVASLLQILAKNAHHDKRTANALLAKAAERCAEKGIPYLTYDRFNYGNKRDTSLREFKERHGFFEMQVPCYYVPLTAWGAVCLKTGLYRGLHGILPHSVLIRGRESSGQVVREGCTVERRRPCPSVLPRKPDRSQTFTARKPTGAP